MEIFSYWPFFWFGCWSEFGDEYSDCPSIDEFLDPNWDYPHLDKLIEYLNRSPIIATTSRMAIPWAKGKGDNRSAISYRSDGEWLWLDDLDYYLREHNLRLPDSLIEHIERAHFLPPDELSVDPRELNWPPIK